MLAEFSTPVRTRVITLSAVRFTTGLDWNSVDSDVPVIMKDKGATCRPTPILAGLPETALEGEAFSMEVSHVAVGHLGIIGGGAWDSKRKTLANRMLPIAWDRVTWVADNWRD